MKSSSCLYVGFSLCLVSIFSCDNADSHIQKEEIRVLHGQVQSFKDHYNNLLCQQNALEALQCLDCVLDAGVSLDTYRQKSSAAQTALQNISCAQIEPLLHIAALYELAARIWEARLAGQGGALAAAFFEQIYPLWLKYNYPWPPSLNRDLQKMFDDYGQAAGPQAAQYQRRLQAALNQRNELDILADIANQLLWHEAHNKLEMYKNILMAPPLPLE